MGIWVRLKACKVSGCRVNVKARRETVIKHVLMAFGRIGAVDKTRIAAWWVALSVNAFFVCYLLTAQRQAWVSVAPESSQNRVQLFFIPKPKLELVAEPAQNIVQSQPRTRQMPQQKAVPRSSRAVADAEQPAIPVTDRPDDWFVAGASPAQSITRPDEDFVRDPLQRQPARMEATRARMRLAFRDSSLGGRLHSLSQAGICKELRAQLGSNPASASAILASMRRHGCIKAGD
ncbi:hypothetical protein CO612_09555 [Lysobacteraceae bacterium NML71-0210]|nr:hypothetical protein CO612_09555 [Xanthomonadaceae bacterium NML71-0210]